MPQETNLNVAPYFDDYTPEDNYHKILFKPGHPVQARELTGIQSILQNQIEKFGEHIFKDGASVTGGGVVYNPGCQSVRIENDTGNPDFITGNEFARVGIVQNPKSYGTSSNLEIDKASAVYALKLTGVGASNATFTADDFVTQTIGIGSTAVGRVISYDQNTQVLKYWQDRTTAGFNTNGTANTSPEYGFRLNRFTNNIIANQGSLNITGGSVTLGIHSSFTGISTVINSKTYYLGQSFTKGVANPEVRKYSGNIIYVDNRPSITRSANQKEDIKVILQF